MTFQDELTENDKIKIMQFFEVKFIHGILFNKKIQYFNIYGLPLAIIFQKRYEYQIHV